MPVTEPALLVVSWVLALGAVCSGCSSDPLQPASPSDHAMGGGPAERAEIVIQDYSAGVSAVHSRNPELRLSVGQDPALPGESVLLVEYPPAGDDPASRDVWCDAEHTDWSPGSGVSFRAKPERAAKISVSFLDNNGVAYTAWRELAGGVWQDVVIPFEEIQPNPYFQPPDAKQGLPIDVSKVDAIGFNPGDPAAGHLSLSKFVVAK